MSSAEAPRRPVVHIERTVDPAVLRWVVHEPALPATPADLVPPAGSLLAGLFIDGRLVGLQRAGGDVYVRVADPAGWTVLAGDVDQALAAALGEGSTWLFGCSSPAGDPGGDGSWLLALPSSPGGPVAGCSSCSRAGRGC